MPSVKTLRFSTDSLPEAERLEFVREVFGRAVCKLDMEPLPEHPLRFEGVLQALPGLAFLSCDVSAMRTSRAGQLLADSNDDIGLYLMRAGQGRISQFGHEVVVGAGDAAFNTGGDQGAESGALTKTGSGILALTGTNTFTGGTIISAGILQMGNGGSSGSVVGQQDASPSLLAVTAD